MGRSQLRCTHRWGLLSFILIPFSPTSAPTQSFSRIRLDTVLHRVDGRSGGEVAEFGTINGGALSIAGLAIVIDRAKNRLVVLGNRSNKQLISTLGRTGSGPGEFRYPLGLRWFDSRTLTVFDDRLARLTFYSVQDGELRYNRDEVLSERPADFCFFNQRLVTFRYDATGRSILHWAQTRSLRQLSTGSPFIVGSPLVESATSRGLILCLPEHGLVIAGSLYAGELRAYSPAGNLVWRRQFPEYIPLKLRELPSGFVFEGTRQGEDVVNHMLVSICRVDHEHIMLQFGLAVLRKHRWSDLTFARVETRILRSRDGTLVGSQSDLPVILAINGTRALTAGGEPEPWVELRRLQFSRQ